ncbi:MAG: pyridoxal phosphate-dependent aminotransferase [Acidimicrobiales bacterium]
MKATMPRLARRVAAAYLPDEEQGGLGPMQSMGRIYPAFGAVFSDADARAADVSAFADGRLLDMGIGRYFPTSPAVIDAAVAALQKGTTRYLDSDPLKEAVAAKFADEQGVVLDPSTQVLLLGGARAGIMLAMLALVDDGDEVVVPDPDYLGLSHAAVVAGGRLRRPAMQLRPDGSLEPDLERILACIGSATSVVALTNPGNPTGWLWTEGQLRELVDATRRVGATLVVNEVYDRLLLDPARRHVGVLTAAGTDGVVVIGGVAKCYDMTGFHLGWLVAGPQLTATLCDLRFLAHQAEPAAVSQCAAVAALTPPVREQHPLRSAAAMAANARAVIDALAGIPGVLCPFPPAGQFAFPFAGGDDQVVAEQLKQDVGVCVIPGSAWGRTGRGHLRLTLANPPDVQAMGLERLRAGLLRRRGGAS